MSRAVAIVEARMGSTRLPGKSMMKLAGAPLVERVLARVQKARTLDAVVVATSTSEKDDVLADHVRSLGVAVHRGSESDVLGRILGAARAHEATMHVQIWGDCPFVSASEIDRCVEALRTNEVDLTGNDLGVDRTVPLGLDVLAFWVSALERADRETTGDAYHREHGTTYLYETGKFRCLKIDTPPELRHPSLRLTIDTAEDFAFVQTVYERLGTNDPTFDVREVIQLLETDPELAARRQAAPKVAASNA